MNITIINTPEAQPTITVSQGKQLFKYSNSFVYIFFNKKPKKIMNEYNWNSADHK